MSGVMRSILSILGFVMFLASCGLEEGELVGDAAGSDGSGGGGGMRGTGAGTDLGWLDAGSGSTDLGWPDAGSTDPGWSDSGSTDPGWPDAGATDRGWFRFSEQRCGAHVFLDDTGVTMERTSIASEACGSAAGVAPYAGVFYGEFTRLADPGGAAFGVGPDGMSVHGRVGEALFSAALIDGGAIALEGDLLPSNFDASSPTYGIIVDRREADPIVHFIAGFDGDKGRIVGSFRMEGFPGDLYLYASGPRLALGAQARINAGEDLRIRPFVYDPRAALTGIDEEAAAALVLGLREQPLGDPDEAPEVQLSGPTEVRLGEEIELSVTASDNEDGDLTAALTIEDDALVYSDCSIELEDGRRYRGAIVGKHRLRAWVRDSRGQLGQSFHSVTVIGELECPVETRLVGSTGDGAVLSQNGLSVRFTRTEKIGVRGNAPIFGDFRYFEVSREGQYGNFGAGIVSGVGELIPYALRNVPASTSLNFISGIWRNLIYFASYPEEASRDVVGLAVDFRGEHPIVHYVLDGELVASVPVPELKTPAYPMLYGSMSAGNGPQLRANFGSEPFVYDARAILAAAGVDGAEELEAWDCAGDGTNPG